MSSDATDSPVVQLDVDDHGIALITLNRPDRLNAWTAGMQRGYFGHLEDCANREDVRVIVVTGAGRGFCAGVDMEALQSISDEGAQDGGPWLQTFPLTVRKPIIAAINGA